MEPEVEIQLEITPDAVTDPEVDWLVSADIEPEAEIERASEPLMDPEADWEALVD